MSTILTYDAVIQFDSNTHLPLARVIETVARELEINPLSLAIDAYSEEDGSIMLLVDSNEPPYKRFFGGRVELPTKTVDGQLRPQEVVLENSPCKKMPKLLSLVAFTVAGYLEQAK